MGEVLLLLVVALTVAAVVFGVTVLVSGKDPGLTPAEPDGRAVPLPGSRPLDESDVSDVRFDTALRGYRMSQVDAALRRAAYDIGYKTELIGVLEAENEALRDGRTEDADALRRAREEAAATRSETEQAPDPSTPEPVMIDLSAPEPPARTDADGQPGAPAEAGVAEAPAAAATEDTVSPADGIAGGPADDDRERGSVVRSESA
ncbi:DivIVA domain-containing protein [Micromonospora tulbaghiae]|uniref:DivIVA domain-containing protein n=1 Tax=Micromonospora tulbaghiae TaxID=479978 RepID=A0AAW4JD13_9ACTN|nr:DivIVA domain-containing protein [Micromonospora tulbaghiae]MBO4139234.1 DivIVA domain-containing protein [Micromonospora tulbaghiae]MDX5456348.1 DivIVA domain-containing protein [Micromonospora tulbaghiae]SCE69211.1 DivIVA domain-containing protein [Micromonospora tulbaghiae]